MSVAFGVLVMTMVAILTLCIMALDIRVRNQQITIDRLNHKVDTVCTLLGEHNMKPFKTHLHTKETHNG